MPTYGKDNFKESNVNYLNKDFSSFKTSLMNYAKSYFPNSYRDFNETSPGMMLLELNAYVGDVLSFYIDQQYREMLLPLAEERRNVINLANMFGYKVKPIVPSYVDLTFTQNLNSNENASEIDYSTGGIFNSGIQIRGSNESITFETLDILDFKVSGSGDTDTISTYDNAGLALSYSLKRKVTAVSAKNKIISFDVRSPEKFKKLIIPDTNVVDIISCIDSNGNDWYEVDFLAQDKVPIPTHYTSDSRRNNPYQNLQTGQTENIAVPYSLQYIKTSKRFTRETNTDNTTSLIFGNGVLRDGQLVDDGFIDLEQVGIIVPGQTNDLNNAINPLLGDEYSTLGETPNQTTLTITYRVGGGINSNVPSGDLTVISAATTLPGSGASSSELSVTNEFAARGGKNEESVDEIKEKAKAFFTTQNRCVTKEDYEARVMNIPAKFGNIAKVYVTRNQEGDTGYGQTEFNEQVSTLQSQINGIINGGYAHNYQSNQYQEGLIELSEEGGEMILNDEGFNVQYLQKINNIITALQELQTNQVPQIAQTELSTFELSGINIYVLSYDTSKQLVGNPAALYNNDFSDFVPSVLKSNIKNYLDNFKILTDTVAISDGFIVNFGVFFDVVAQQYADKAVIKVKCIQKIREYFKIEKMQFNQPIYISQLEFELMGVEGVRSVNYVSLTQKVDNHPKGVADELENPTYTYSFNSNSGPDNDGDGFPDGGYDTDPNSTSGYGYLYDFSEETGALRDGVIRPPLPSTPTVFELKNPNQNIKGRVR